MRKRTLAVIAVFAWTLTACQTAAQHQAQVIHQNDTTAMTNLKGCYASVYNSALYAPLRPHIPLTGQFTLEQLSDQSHATDEGIRAIYAEHPQTTACRQIFLNQLASVTPGYVPIFTSAWDRSEDVLIQLVQKKLTWGEYATTVRGVSHDLLAQVHAEDQRIAAGLEQSHQAELARRQAAAAAMAQYIQNQQMINAATRPVVTNCNAYGNSATCVTQ